MTHKMKGKVATLKKGKHFNLLKQNKKYFPPYSGLSGLWSRSFSRTEEEILQFAVLIL